METHKKRNVMSGLALGATVALGGVSLASCSNEKPPQPTTVFIQQSGGHTLLQGCFTGFGNKDVPIDAVGTLTLAPEANDNWKFTFRTVDGKHSRLIEMSELALAKVYDPGTNPVYTAPKETKDEPTRTMECREDLLMGRTVPEYTKGQFATVVIHNGNGPTKSMLGPINSKTYIRSTTEGLGEHVTPVGGREIVLERIVP